jgi:hypothetical protein
MPAVTVLKGHINPVLVVLAGHRTIIGNKRRKVATSPTLAVVPLTATYDLL